MTTILFIAGFVVLALFVAAALAVNQAAKNYGEGYYKFDGL